MAGNPFDTYVTVDGDMVDLIAFRRFGDSLKTAAIFDANPGLAALGPILDAGVSIRIPVQIAPVVKQSNRLWS